MTVPFPKKPSVLILTYCISCLQVVREKEVPKVSDKVARRYADGLVAQPIGGPCCFGTEEEYNA